MKKLVLFLFLSIASIVQAADQSAPLVPAIDNQAPVPAPAAQIQLQPVQGTITASAKIPTPVVDPLDPAMFFSDKLILNDKEQRAVDNARKWLKGGQFPYRNGDEIVYLFGDGQPVLVCSPLQVCMIRLGAGEKVSKNGIHLGDSARWQVSPAVGDKDKTLLIIKPIDTGLRTSLIIITDKRSYHIALSSSQTDLTPIISFKYPDDVAQEWVDYYTERENKAKAAEAKRKAEIAAAEAKRKAEIAAAEAKRKADALEADKKRQWLTQENEKKRKFYAEQAAKQQQQQKAEQQKREEVQKQEVAKKEERTIPETRQDIATLDFNYRVSACNACGWRVKRVYNDGSQTIVQLSGIKNTEAPVFLVLGSAGDQQLVNYRVNGDTYIVDKVFSRGVLLAGVGKTQDKILIDRVRASQ